MITRKKNHVNELVIGLVQGLAIATAITEITIMADTNVVIVNVIVIAIILEIVIITTTRSEVVEEGVVAEVVVEVVEEGHGTDGVITSQDQAIMIWIALRISRREGEDIHLQRPRPKNGKFVLAPIPIRSRKLNNNPRIV